MPNIKDQSTVNEIAQVFTSNGRNKLEALKTVGYKPSYYNTLGIGRVYSNIRVIDAIAKIDAHTAITLGHDRAKAIKLLTDNITALDKIILSRPNNVQAINARTVVIRELNAISALHSNTVIAADTTEALTEETRAILEESARQTNLKLSESRTG